MQLPAIAPSWVPLLADPEEYDGGERDELARQELLPDPQGPRPLDVVRASLDAPSLEEALALLEAWSPAEEAKHPRWPKGTPGGLGGHFMKTGQRFMLHGIEYDVAFTAPGGVYAHVATKGVTSKAKLEWIPATALSAEGHAEIKGIARPPVDVSGYANAAHYQTASLKATVIDPYVQHDHDATIPLPADAPPGMTAERWERFGRADQLRYIDLMHQFGKWSDAKAQTMVNAELSKKPHDLVAFVKSAYQSQFGSSSGFSIGLLQTFSKWFQSGHKPTAADLEKDRSKFEATKQVQDAAARVIQWDLYNRVKAPDIAVFHKSHDVKSWWQNEILSSKAPTFSGVSQSQRYQPGGFGPVAVASPLAIRNIVMATTSADIHPSPFGGKKGDSEQEVSIGEPMRLDSRSFVFNDSDLSAQQKQWLTSQTQAGTDGSILEVLRNNVEKGIPLPALPEPANLVMHSENNKQWVAPPPSASHGVDKLGYAEVDADGIPVAHPAKELDLKPGDYIEGMKGTRYIVIADPGSSFGVRYYKLTDSGHAVGVKKPYTSGPIHDEATGHQAYSGHTNWLGSGNPEESYDFTIDLPFKKLAGHFELPTQKAETGVTFAPGAWAISGEKKPVSQLGVGGKFYLDGVPLEVQQVHGAKQVTVKSLTSGLLGDVNGAYATNYLKLKEGYTEEGVPAFNPGDYFVHPAQHLTDMGLKPDDLLYGGSSGAVVWKVQEYVSTMSGSGFAVVQVSGSDPGKTNVLGPELLGRKLEPKPPGWLPAQVGDTVAWAGKKATVTKLLKGGQVQLNLAPGVVKVKPDDPALAYLYSVGNHELGPKMKVKDMTPGQKFHGGTGGKIRPYLVLALEQKQEGKAGKFALVKNLDTGEDSYVGYQKAFKLLVPQGGPVSTEPGDADLASQAQVFNPAAWKPGAATTFTQLKVSDKFLGVDGNTPFEVTADKGAAWEVKNLMTGALMPAVKMDVPTHLLEPSNVMPPVAYDPDAYIVGKPKKLSELKVGDIFVGATNGKHYLVTKTGAKSGLTAVDLTTGKSSAPWGYDKVAAVLEPKGVVGAKGDVMKGAALPLSQVEKGGQFTLGGVLHEVIEPADGKEGNATVAQVLPDGSLAFPGKVGYYPSLLVTFNATAADKVKPAPPQQEAIATMDALDGLSWLQVGTSSVDVVPFSAKSKTGGGYFFTKAKHADEGVVLVDKNGHHFKVKVAGSDPVVSDGSSHWFLPGEGNYKIDQSGTFDDHAPALAQAQGSVLAQEAMQTPPMQQAGDKMVKDLDLEPGDWILKNGKPLQVTKVTVVPGTSVTAWQFKSEGGSSVIVGGASVADAYAKKQPNGEWEVGPTGSAAMPLVPHISPNHPAAGVLENGANSVTLDGFYKNTSVIAVDELSVGQMFANPTAQPGQGNIVWKVLGPADVDGEVPLEIVAIDNPANVSLIGTDAHVSGSYVPGWIADAAQPAAPGIPAPPAPASPLAHAIKASLDDEWADNSLVKLSTAMLKPGQLYKSTNGSTFLWHGALPSMPSGFAEVVADESEVTVPGQVLPIPLGYVPAQIGPVVDFHSSEWEPVGQKILMTGLHEGEVFSMAGGDPVKVVSMKNGLTVVGPVPDAQTGEGAPYKVAVTSGTPVELWVPKAATPSPSVASSAGEAMKLADMPPGTSYNDPFTPGDVHTVVAHGSYVAGVWTPAGASGTHVHVTSESGDNAYYPKSSVHAQKSFVVAPPAIPSGADTIPGSEGWTNNPQYLSVAQLPVGAQFVWGGGADVYTVKSHEDGKVITTKNEGEGGANEGGPGAFVSDEFVPSQLWLPPPLAVSEMTPISNLPVGAQFKDTAGAFGSPDADYEVVGTSEYDVTVRPLAGGEPFDIAGDDDPDADVGVLSWGPSATKSPLPHPLDGFGSWKDGVKIGDLAVGDQFGEGSGDSYFIGEITGPPLAGKVLYKVVQAGPNTAFAVGEVGTTNVTHTPDWYKQAGGGAEKAALEKLAAAIKAGDDPNDYFEAENAIRELIATQKGIDPVAVNEQEFDDWVAEKSVEHGVEIPAGPDYDPQDYASDSPPPFPPDWFDETTAGLPVGTEFETPSVDGPNEPGDKFTVTAQGPGWLKAVPIGMEDDGLEITWATPEAATELGLPPHGYESHGPAHVITLGSTAYNAPDTSMDAIAAKLKQVGDAAAQASDAVKGLKDQLSAPPPGAQEVFASALESGDHFYEADGTHWVVNETTPNQVIATIVGGGTSGPFNPAEVVYVDKDSPLYDHPAVTASSTESPLKPYSPKSKTGGGYFFANLGQLEHGTEFTDKTGTVYVAGNETLGGKKQFWAKGSDGDLPAFVHDATARVKLIHSK